jgi:hypothetical protein
MVVVVVEPKEIDQSEADIACGGVGQTGASEPKNQLFMYQHSTPTSLCRYVYMCVLVSLI